MLAQCSRVGMAHACNEHLCAHKGLGRHRLCQRGYNRQFASMRAVQVYGYGQFWCCRVVSWCICHGSMSNVLPFCQSKIVFVSLLTRCDPLRALGYSASHCQHMRPRKRTHEQSPGLQTNSKHGQPALWLERAVIPVALRHARAILRVGRTTVLNFHRCTPC